MSIKIIRDLNEELSWNGDSNAVLAFTPTPNEKQQYVVAGGRPADQLYSGLRPLAWLKDSSGAADESNTDEHFAEWFDTLEEAEAYIADVKAAIASTAK